MSERQVYVQIYLRPVTPSFDGIRRFMVCLDRPAHPDNFEVGLCGLAVSLPAGNWYQYFMPIEVGAHYASIGVYLAEEEEYIVDVLIKAFDGITTTPLYYITTYALRLGEPRSLSFRITPEQPWIEGLVLTPLEEAEERKQEVIALSTNNPDTVNIIDAVNKVGSDLWDAVTGLRGGLSGLAGLATSAVASFFMSLLGNIPSLINRGSDSYADKTVKTLIDLASGSPEWATLLQKNQDPLTAFFLGQIPKQTGVENWLPEEKTPENYINNVYGMASEFMRLSITAKMTGAGMEIASLGQVEGFNELFDTIINQFGLIDITKTVITYPTEQALITPYKHAINSAYPNEIPTEAELINMVIKEKISLDFFKETMLKKGRNVIWSQLIWDAHFIAPDYDNIRTAYHKGNILETELLPMLKRVDLDPEFNEKIWLPNLWTIPPYTDLINMRVKEVISGDIFAQNLRAHGYDPIWGQRLWDAHFFPPTQGDIITAYRRQIPVTIPEFDTETGILTPRQVEQLTLDDVHKLMELVDLDPRYTSIFDVRIHNDPTIRQARYMFETGSLIADEVKEIVRRSGLAPQYIDPMTEYLIEFTEREYRRRYLTALQSGVMSGVYNAEDLTSAVTEAGFPIGVAQWMLKTAEVRMKIAEAPKTLVKAKLLSISDLKKAYLKDFIDDATLKLHLDTLGYEFNDIELLVRLLDDAKRLAGEGGRQVVLTSAQLLNAFRYDKIEEGDLRDRLMLKGLAMDEAQLIIDTKKMQWGVGGVTS